MFKTKIDILQKMKEYGYTPTSVTRDGLLSSVTVTQLRESRKTGILSNISLESLNRICLMCKMQPGDIIELYPTDQEKIKYFSIVHKSN